MRVGDDEQVEPVQAVQGLGQPRDGVAAVTRDHHGADRALLVDLVGRQVHRIEPARRGDTRRLHALLARARLAAGLGRHFVEARLQPVVLDLPDAGPMLPAAFDEPVIERQRRHIEAEIGRALNVGVSAEDVGAGARLADIAGGQAEDAQSPDIGGADRVLGRAHAPDQRRGLLLGKELGDALELLARNPGDPLDLLGRPLGDFLADVVHAVDALADEVLVLPAVLEDVPEHAPGDRNVGAGADPHVLGRMRGGAREARVDDHEVGAVDLLAGQDVLHRDRVRLGRVAPHDDHGPGIAQVVVGIGLGAVAPGVGHARHRGRVADASLMVGVVGPPEGAELPQQIGRLVGVLGRAQPVDGVGAVRLADLEELVADLLDGLIPRDAVPLPACELHRVFQAPVAGHEFANGRALGAMRAAVDRACPGRLLADPDAVHDLGGDRAAHRAMGADVPPDGHVRPADRGAGGVGLAHRPELDRAGRREASGHETGPAQEAAPVEGRCGRLPWKHRRPRWTGLTGSALDQHAGRSSAAMRPLTRGTWPL
ncbi:hypothetical protein AEGHOMDF_5163 [Methylobacterium soli]|nr:hypothetical protein AEGHOMDF_5163 [Methylobacterium soli]